MLQDSMKPIRPLGEPEATSTLSMTTFERSFKVLVLSDGLLFPGVF